MIDGNLRLYIPHSLRSDVAIIEWAADNPEAVIHGSSSLEFANEEMAILFWLRFGDDFYAAAAADAAKVEKHRELQRLRRQKMRERIKPAT
ncbi:hypothetical protein BRX37_16735 [Sphingomonas sp. S-NIH.Pt3_0716]|jgi:hypothetical protein|nr:hypothetical protein BRX37_16735 [Sphingomonas sp. S-NIH.Pt3_0716]